MSEHTPGPWKVVIEGDDVYIVTPCEKTAIAKPVARRLDGCGEANARLIAAAPELLDVLIRARRCLAWACEQRPEFEAEYDLANSAIAKATGEA